MSQQSSDLDLEYQPMTNSEILYDELATKMEKEDALEAAHQEVEHHNFQPSSDSDL